MKTIKIIDLLSKIVNGEEIPKKINYQDEIYEWDEELKKYSEQSGYTLEIYTKRMDLTETVEIIEDNTEEIEKIGVDKNGFIHTNNGTWKGRKLDVSFADKLNELVEEVNKLKNN